MKKIIAFILFSFFSLLVTALIPTNLFGQEILSNEKTWLKVITNLPEYFIVVDDDYSNAQLVQRGDSILLSPGDKSIIIVNEIINDHFIKNLNLIEEQTNTIQVIFSNLPLRPQSSFQILKQQYNLEIITDSSSSIFINDEYVGDYTAKLIVPSGKHHIRIKHPEEGELKYNFTKKRVHQTDHIARYVINPNEISFAAHLIPGAGYISSKSTIKLVTTYSLMAGLAGLYILQNKEYQDTHAKYKHYEMLYAETTNTRDAITFRKEANKAISSLESTKSNMAITAILLGATYVISTIDGFRKPKSGYKGSITPKKHDVSLDSYSYNNSFTPVLSYKYYF